MKKIFVPLLLSLIFVVQPFSQVEAATQTASFTYSYYTLNNPTPVSSTYKCTSSGDIRVVMLLRNQYTPTGGSSNRWRYQPYFISNEKIYYNGNYVTSSIYYTHDGKGLYYYPFAQYSYKDTTSNKNEPIFSSTNIPIYTSPNRGDTNVESQFIWDIYYGDQKPDNYVDIPENGIGAVQGVKVQRQTGTDGRQQYNYTWDRYSTTGLDLLQDGVHVEYWTNWVLYKKDDYTKIDNGVLDEKLIADKLSCTVISRPGNIIASTLMDLDDYFGFGKNYQYVQETFFQIKVDGSPAQYGPIVSASNATDLLYTAPSEGETLSENNFQITNQGQYVTITQYTENNTVFNITYNYYNNNYADPNTVPSEIDLGKNFSIGSIFSFIFTLANLLLSLVSKLFNGLFGFLPAWAVTICGLFLFLGCIGYLVRLIL